MAHYPSEDQAIASTTASRLNGYLGGSGSAEQLERDIDRLGLSEAGQSYLRKATGHRSKPLASMLLSALSGT
ncbi:MAG: hypothetical protein AAFY88_22955 [Acidobacteriota bacterium]